MDKKVTVIGAGNVGATLAQRLAEKELCDVALIDTVEGLAQGKALDILQASPVEIHDADIYGSNSLDSSGGSDIIVITAGIARQPGMSRDDLLNTNSEIVSKITNEVKLLSPNAILIIVTNPLDAMCYAALKASGFEKNRVIGMAGALDSARFRTFIAQELGVSMENVTAFVLGGHGDTMVPLPRYSTVAGIPITHLLPGERINSLVERTKNGGAEIVSLLKTGSAYYAPSAATAEMVEAILKDKKKIIPCSAYLEGEYGIRGLFMGVPVKLGSQGIEQIIQIKLSAEEKEMFSKSAVAIKELTSPLM